jgi:hypothetical protein
MLTKWNCVLNKDKVKKMDEWRKTLKDECGLEKVFFIGDDYNIWGSP